MSIERILEPENGRYGAELLFVHGLWTGPDVWEPVARGFAHRGWRCVLLDDSSVAPKAPLDFSGWVESVAVSVAARPAPPVLIGHDAGALVALAIAQRGGARAVVAVAPLLEGAAPLLAPATRWLSRLRRSPLPPPSPAHPYRRTASESAAIRLRSVLTGESPARVASLRGGILAPAAPAVPLLLAAQRDDAVVPRALVEVTARGIEADYRLLPGGHWALLEEAIDPWMSELHRWIIRRVGSEILMLRGDEDLREE